MVENVLSPHFQCAKVLLVPQHQYEMHVEMLCYSAGW